RPRAGRTLSSWCGHEAVATTRPCLWEAHCRNQRLLSFFSRVCPPSAIPIATLEHHNETMPSVAVFHFGNLGRFLFPIHESFFTIVGTKRAFHKLAREVVVAYRKTYYSVRLYLDGIVHVHRLDHGDSCNQIESEA